MLLVLVSIHNLTSYISSDIVGSLGLKIKDANYLIGVKRMKAIEFIGRQKYRLGRGQSYISIINTMLLIGIAFKLTSPAVIGAVGVGALFCVWLVGMVDDRLRIVHAESNHGVEATTPYFQELKREVVLIREMLQEFTGDK